LSYNRWDMSKFSNERAETLDADLDILLDNLCRHWDFCNRLSGNEALSNDGRVDASEFADSVLRGEGFTPADEPEYRAAIQRAFLERYGRAEISVESYSNSTIT